MCNALLVVQVTDLAGLEAGELRGKVGSNVLDNTVVSLTGSDIELAPHLRHAGMLFFYICLCVFGIAEHDGFNPTPWQIGCHPALQVDLRIG